jgi:carboxypeptidase T
VFLDKGQAIIGRQKFNDLVKARPGIFINGAHHPREMTGVSMTMYLMMRLLHSWTHRFEMQVENILLNQLIDEKAAIFFIPIVNIDGVRHISKVYTKTGKLLKVRKNMQDYRNGKKCKTPKLFQVGVDLNRNYAHGFGDEGASADPCHWLYRGPFPFSEPETQAVRNFLYKWDNIKFGINFHAYGNFLCVPFHNGDTDNRELQKPQYKLARSFFNKLE